MNEGGNVEHIVSVECEWEDGGRFWSRPMPDSEVVAFIDSFAPDLYLSDIDCVMDCPACQTLVVESN